MPRTILVINGPNLNLLGEREPAIYGSASLADIEAACRASGAAHGLEVQFRQSNHEGALVDWIQAARHDAAALVVNAGALSHSSIAILDALRAFSGPIVEVHLSNLFRREAFRQHSYVALAATGVICGLGAAGYALAIQAIAGHLAAEATGRIGPAEAPGAAEPA